MSGTASKKGRSAHTSTEMTDPARTSTGIPERRRPRVQRGLPSERAVGTNPLRASRCCLAGSVGRPAGRTGGTPPGLERQGAQFAHDENLLLGVLQEVLLESSLATRPDKTRRQHRRRYEQYRASAFNRRRYGEPATRQPQCAVSRLARKYLSCKTRSSAMPHTGTGWCG